MAVGANLMPSRLKKTLLGPPCLKPLPNPKNEKNYRFESRGEFFFKEV
jgi:hypothetical protein